MSSEILLIIKLSMPRMHEHGTLNLELTAPHAYGYQPEGNQSRGASPLGLMLKVCGRCGVTYVCPTSETSSANHSACVAMSFVHAARRFYRLGVAFGLV